MLFLLRSLVRRSTQSKSLLVLRSCIVLPLDRSLLTARPPLLLINRAQKNDKVLTEAEPAPTFSLTLRPYQKQALHWMSNIELGVKSGREATMHPLWEE
jgi:DNA repair protein RAD5